MFEVFLNPTLKIGHTSELLSGYNTAGFETGLAINHQFVFQTKNVNGLFPNRPWLRPSETILVVLYGWGTACMVTVCLRSSGVPSPKD